MITDVKIFKLPFISFTYCLTTSKEDEKSLCAAIDLDPTLMGDMPRDGQCLSISSSSKGDLNIVRINAPDGTSLSECLGLLAHEVNHVKRNYMECLGEESPSAEFECYIIQEITAELTNEYLRRR